MSVEYHKFKGTNMDVEDSKIGYKQLFPDGKKLQFSVYALKNNAYKVATICLGLTCIILLAGVIGETVLHRRLEREHQKNFTALKTDKENLKQNLNVARKEKKDIEIQRDRLLQHINYLSSNEKVLQTNINSLKEEKNKLKLSESQLQTSQTAQTKELEQLKATNLQLKADKDVMVTAKNNLQAQYDLIVKNKKELEVKVLSLNKERDNLQNKFNNATRAREQLQLTYNELIQKVEHLQDVSTSEKDKLASSHQNLTMEMKTLQETCNIIKKAENELQASYQSALNQKKETEILLKNVTAERDQLNMKASNLTGERDQLLETVNKLNATIQVKKCPSGWTKFQYSCYYTSATKKTWSQSRAYCQSKNADLAIIKSQEEMTFINSLYSSDKEVWIGLTDGGVEGQWKWVDGTPLVLSFWARNQPNSHKGTDQDCVEFWHRVTGSGDWNDENCTIEQYWICEL